MKNILLLILVLSNSYLCFTQEYFVYLNSNKYPASKSVRYYLKSNSYDDNSSNYVNIRFAVDNKNGLIELTQNLHDHRLIVGEIQIFLANGNFIKCFDYKNRDNIGGVATTIYRLTESEVNYLRVNNISKIRYSTANFYTNKKDDKELYYKKEDFLIPSYTKTSLIINQIFTEFGEKNKFRDYDALFNAVTHESKKENFVTTINVKPNHAEFGRKYGKRREPTTSGQINSMSVVFSNTTVKIYDEIETATFDIVSYEWMDDNLLWIDFSSKPQEFYMVIAFDSDGLVFINNENDPQPGEEYKSLYFKELSKKEFKNIYK